jgi:hypothetical protein
MGTLSSETRSKLFRSWKYNSQLENKHRNTKRCIGDYDRCVFRFSSNRIVLRATIESTHWLPTLSQLDSRFTRITEICGTARTINFQVLNNSTPDLDEQYQLMACSAHYEISAASKAKLSSRARTNILNRVNWVL